MNINPSLMEPTYYAVAASVTVLGVLYKLTKSAIKKLKNEIVLLQQDREKLRVVFNELTPNHGSSMKDQLGKVKEELSLNTEITEKTAKRCIIISGKLDMIYETDAVARFECELPSGKCIWSNTALQKMFGLTEAEMLGDGWLNALHPEDIEPTYKQWMNTIANSYPYKARYRIIVGNTVIHVEAQAKILRDKNGKAISALGTIKILPEGK